MRYRNTTLAAATLLVLSMSSCAPSTDTGEPSGAAGTWPSYTLPDGSLSFEHRPDWTVEEVQSLANDPAGGVSVQVNDAGGDLIAQLDTGIITGLVCDDPDEAAQYVEYDSEPMPELDSAQGTDQRFVYRSVAFSTPERGEPVATYAVISELGDRGQCGLFDFFTFTESSGGRFAGRYSGEDTVPGQSYLDGAAAYEDSAEFRDVKRMLVSLRDKD
ncbi:MULTISPECIES: hypothetical protein [Arthrobacter]|uniref:Lipoprotein n=1 Tax=Arthrobacter sunyaminii TaxID=2816859 RepID=A0A975XLH5_9MICC|nr:MULTISPECIES: hypothetical protein [Arthrobacter]MBO0896291.1 hypothetical protein [Arthrobacter sunyaminii]MBO0907998.1 hypothetical protein [Arthrobacter sunyaminii]QWQ37041.1 hypothetical protein KG104_04405 [Arthrobacter sunyaminii]